MEKTSSDPLAAIRTCFTKYADFSGRADRPEFWWFFLAVFVINTVVSRLPGIGGGVVSLVVTLALVLPSLAAGARRLHDTGRSGWWQLLLLIPLIGFIVLVVWWASAGEQNANQYGQIPGGLPQAPGWPS